MGSVFRLIRIEQQQTNLCGVQLKLSADIDQQLADYTKRTREQTRTSYSFLSLLKLMNELSQYSSVDQFAEMLREDVALSANPSILAAVHHMFGSIYHARGELKKGVGLFFKNHLQSILSPDPNNHAVAFIRLLSESTESNQNRKGI